MAKGIFKMDKEGRIQRGENERFERLKEDYIMDNPDEIEDFLERHGDDPLYEVLEEAPTQIHKIFDRPKKKAKNE